MVCEASIQRAGGRVLALLIRAVRDEPTQLMLHANRGNRFDSISTSIAQMNDHVTTQV